MERKAIGQLTERIRELDKTRDPKQIIYETGDRCRGLLTSEKRNVLAFHNHCNECRRCVDEASFRVRLELCGLPFQNVYKTREDMIRSIESFHKGNAELHAAGKMPLALCYDEDGLTDLYVMRYGPMPKAGSANNRYWTW